MISSNQVEWNGLISKEGRGIDDADFGEVIRVDSDNATLMFLSRINLKD
jgi:hypothetical protein